MTDLLARADPLAITLLVVITGVIASVQIARRSASEMMQAAAHVAEREIEASRALIARLQERIQALETRVVALEQLLDQERLRSAELAQRLADCIAERERLRSQLSDSL